MKYFPTKYNHTQNYPNESSLKGVDLHHKYEPIPAPKGRREIKGLISRIFIASKNPYNVGDVLIGTITEFIALFGTKANLNMYTRLADVKGAKKPSPVLIEIEEEPEGIIEDSLKYPENKIPLIMYKGVSIEFKPVVNGVLFSSVDEAEKAIDMALQLKL